MSIIATWYACRQNIEFWNKSDLGFTCGAFNSQPIEFTIWFYKRIHNLHANGNYNQISRMIELFIAATEGSMKHNIPDFCKIKDQQLKERLRWWNQINTKKKIRIYYTNFVGYINIL